MANMFSFNAQTETPAMLAERRRRAEILAGQIGGATTVGGGIGDVIRGLGAGLSRYRADRIQREGEASGRSSMDELLGLLDQPKAQPMTTPSNDAVKSSVMTGLSTGKVPPLATYAPPGPQNAGRPDTRPAPPYVAQQAPPPEAPVEEPVAEGEMPPEPPPSVQQAGFQPASNDAKILPKLLQMLRNPWLSETDRAIVQKRYDDVVKRLDPEYQLKMQTEQTQLDQMQHPDRVPMTALQKAQLEGLQAKPVGTTIWQNYGHAVAQGYKKSFIEYQNEFGGGDGANGPTSAMKNYEFGKNHPDFAKTMQRGKPPANMMWGPDNEDGTPTLVPIEGGAATPGDLSDPSYKDYVTKMANNKVKPPSAGRNPAYRAALMKDILSINPNFDETKFEARQRQANNFAGGPLGATTRSLGVGVAHLDVLQNLGVALQNGDTQIINAARQEWARQFGVAAPPNFDAAKSIVADEIAKGVIGGQSAQSDRETLAASIRNSSSPEQLAGVITTFQQLMAGQLGGLRQQYLSVNPGATDFDETFLTPETKSVLDRFSNVAPIPPPAGPVDPDIPQEAIKQLREDVKNGDLSSATEFEEHFNLAPGAAQMYLGGQ